LAEIAGEYLKKGRPVYVEGRLQTRKWQTKEGQDRYTTEIIADQMQMLGGRDGAGSNASYDGGMDQSSGSSDNYNQAPSSQGQTKQAPAQSAAKPAASGSGFDDFEDDIPF
jgi:single-strand DNA-binding protein